MEANPWAVLVAALTTFLIGGLWYSPKLFGATWCREAGVDPQQGGHPARVFGVAFLLSLLAAGLFGEWLGPDPTLAEALRQGLVVGAGFVAACFGINYQFGNRSVKMWAIDGGYHTVQFLAFGTVLAMWP